MEFHDYSFLLQVTSSSEAPQPSILLTEQNSTHMVSNTEAKVLAWEEVMPEPVQKGSDSPKSQTLITNFFRCSKEKCDFKTKQKRCLDTHIKG